MFNFKNIISIIVLSFSMNCFAVPDVNDVIDGLRNRENFIKDVSYEVTCDQYNNDDENFSFRNHITWKAKDDMWYQDFLSYSADGTKGNNTFETYDGQTRRFLNRSRQDKMRGTVKDENKDRKYLSLTGEGYYLSYNNEKFSDIIENRGFSVDAELPGSDNTVWVHGLYSKSLQMAIKIDISKGFYPATIKLWLPELGHSFEEPSIVYETLEFTDCNGFWMPEKTLYKQREFSKTGKNIGEYMDTFENVKVNSGLTKDDFILKWPKKVKIHDYNIDAEYFSDMSDMISDQGLEWVNEITVDANSSCSKDVDNKCQTVLWLNNFIPDINETDSNVPNLLDLQTNKLKVCREKIYAKQTYDKLNSQKFGDLMWNGTLVGLRNLKVYNLINFPQEKFHCSSNDYTKLYTLPEDVVMPYVFVVVTNENKNFIVKIVKIKKSGIEILYRQPSKNEMDTYKLVEPVLSRKSLSSM